MPVDPELKLGETPPLKDIFPHYEKVVLGHAWRDVDADQITTLCLARALSMIDTTTPIKMTALPSDED